MLSYILGFIGFSLLFMLIVFPRASFFGGIPLLAIELVGLCLLSFAWGLARFTLALCLLVVAVFLAIIFDPYIWKKQGFKDHSHRLSLIVNGGLGVSAVICFVLGYFLSSPR